jgi:hypothetical protein
MLLFFFTLKNKQRLEMIQDYPVWMQELQPPAARIVISSLQILFKNSGFRSQIVPIR